MTEAPSQQLSNKDEWPRGGLWCCGKRMLDDGECYEGCCDDYKCSVCGKRLRVECPD